MGGSIRGRVWINVMKAGAEAGVYDHGGERARLKRMVIMISCGKGVKQTQEQSGAISTRGECGYLWYGKKIDRGLEGR